MLGITENYFFIRECEERAIVASGLDKEPNPAEQPLTGGKEP
jgi:hypothetical protein